ncbi:hypothetical protein GF407_00590 [candidate division KSB1 bacterium]|nr:hypothetical protein [candidate division KSB1 bacterium]
MKSLIDNVAQSPFKAVATLFFLTFICYLWMVNGPFLFQDERYILQNQPVKELDIAKIYTSGDELQGSAGDYSYRPNQQLVFALIYSLFGETPIPYHFYSMLLHFLNTVLVVLLLRNLRFDDRTAFITAMLFAVHPALTQTVSYISAFADLLGTAFLLAGLILFVKFIFADHQKTRLYTGLGVILFFVLAFFSKETMVIALPLSLIITLYIRYEHKHPLHRPVPLILIATALFAIGFIVLKYNVLSANVPGFCSEFENLYFQHYWVRLVTFINILWKYVALIFVPLQLSYVKSNIAFTDLNRLGAVAGIILILFFFISITVIKKRPLLFFTLGWFLMALLPYSGIIPQTALYREHWLYIPIISALLFISVGLNQLIKNKRSAGIAILLLVVLLCGARTIARNLQWSDYEKFYLNEVKQSSSPFRLYNEMATWFESRGLLGKAELYYRKAIQITDRYPEPHYQLANIYLSRNKIDKAIEEFYLALKKDPDFTFALSKLYGIYMRLDQPKKADAILTLMRKNRAGEDLTIEEIEEIVFSP